MSDLKLTADERKRIRFWRGVKDDGTRHPWTELRWAAHDHPDLACVETAVFTRGELEVEENTTEAAQFKEFVPND